MHGTVPNNTPTPRFVTERLLIRPVENTQNDLEMYRSIFGCPDAMRYVVGKPEPDQIIIERHERYWRAWETGGRLYVFAIEPREPITTPHGAKLNPGTPIGDVMLVPVPKDGDDFELGYRLRKDAWCLGLATEAARQLIPHAFGVLRLPHLLAVTDPENEASQRVLLKLGFSTRGTTDAYYDKTLALFILDAPPGPPTRGNPTDRRTT